MKQYIKGLIEGKLIIGHLTKSLCSKMCKNDSFMCSSSNVHRRKQGEVHQTLKNNVFEFPLATQLAIPSIPSNLQLTFL